MRKCLIILTRMNRVTDCQKFSPGKVFRTTSETLEKIKKHGKRREIETSTNRGASCSFIYTSPFNIFVN